MTIQELQSRITDLTTRRDAEVAKRSEHDKKQREIGKDIARVEKELMEALMANQASGSDQQRKK